MQCPCGGSTVYLVHEVKTLKKAKEWYPGLILDAKHLPIEVRRDVCEACGLQLIHQYKYPKLST